MDFGKYRTRISIVSNGIVHFTSEIDVGSEMLNEALQKNFSISYEEAEIMKRLYVKSNVDLAIRTSGEVRTSNFLPFQASYAEWIFIKHHWPGFTKADFDFCLKEFSSRQRRFGK